MRNRCAMAFNRASPSSSTHILPVIMKVLRNSRSRDMKPFFPTLCAVLDDMNFLSPLWEVDIQVFFQFLVKEAVREPKIGVLDLHHVPFGAQYRRQLLGRICWQKQGTEIWNKKVIGKVLSIKKLGKKTLIMLEQIYFTYNLLLVWGSIGPPSWVRNWFGGHLPLPWP